MRCKKLGKGERLSLLGARRFRFCVSLPRVSETHVIGRQTILLAFLWTALYCGGCSESPYRIGFVGGLTGRSSDLGVQGRNGVILAVEEINREGGINGKPLQLLTRDDKQDPQTALKVNRELIDEGVIVIIGHMNSTISEAAAPLVNERRVLMISPATSANKLTGIDDFFLRVVNPSSYTTKLEASHAFEKMGLRRIAALHDLSNRTYSEEFILHFQTEFQRLGGEMASNDSFTAGREVSYPKLVHEVLRTEPDGLLIIAGALDTAMICQHVRKSGAKIPILISGWAQTPDLIHNGGPAVEGVIGTMYQDPDSTSKPYVAFRERFQSRFGVDGPTFAAVFGYEIVMVLKDALTRNPDPHQLKETILKQKNFQGLQGGFEIDSHGDAKRDAYVATVSDKRFKVLDP